MSIKRFALILAGLILMTGTFGTFTQALAASTGAETPGYQMQAYAATPDIRIAYPSFPDQDGLNALVGAQVQAMVPEDTAGVTIDYACAVTLLTRRMASMVFWGYSNVEGSIHPYNDLFTLTVDLDTLQPVALTDLYEVNADFGKVFFAKATFPSDPVTSYSAEGFADALALQVSDLSIYDPFSAEGQIAYFLKPDGLVLSLPAVHASGSDHFEAQLSYADLQPYARLSGKDWED